jgi:tetratricopeptide (TPR) repeat protein
VYNAREVLSKLWPFLLSVFAAAILPAWSQDSALRRAAQLDAEQKCSESEPIYRQALRQGKPSIPLLNNAGNHYLICGDKTKAQDQFEQILRISPQHVNANLQLARLATEQHDGARAEQFLSRVSDNSPQTRMLRAEAAHWAGESAEARAILDALAKEIGADLRLEYLFGLTCARIGDYERAETAFNAVFATHPDDFDVLLNLGRAAARARDDDRAERVLETALRIQPASIDVMLELGQLNAARRDFTRSIYYLTQAKMAAPGRPDVLLALARVSQSGGYYGDAAIAYEEYLRLAPADDSAHRDHALVAGYTESRRAEALRELDAYLKKHPDDAIAYYNRAQLVWRDRPDEAIAHLERAVQLDPSFAMAHLDRGWLLQRQGSAAEAVKDLQAALKIDPRDSRALDLLGLSYLSLDRAADAEPVLRRALEIAPDDPDILMHLGRALMELGREGEGQRLLARFQTLRPQSVRGPRRQAGLIEAASLSPGLRMARQIERLRQDAAAHPDDYDLQLNLASLLLTAGQKEEATKQFRILLSRNAGTAVWEKAGTFLLDFGQYELARDFLLRAVMERPALGLDLAIAYFFAEGPPAALKTLERVPDMERCGDCLLLKASIVDSGGDTAQAQQLLERGVQLQVTRPKIVQIAAALLMRHGRQTMALELLDKATGTNQDLLLTKAVVLGLAGQATAAQKVVKALESQSPEWDRPYLVHGLILERSEPREAAQKIRTAIALGSSEPAAACALARLTPGQSASTADPRCGCARGLSDVLYSSCTATQLR